MSQPISNGGAPLRVAVIGSGPSGFYAAEHLLAQTEPEVRVDLFDRLPTPFGLVRGGVAPDHQKIKTVIAMFEKTAGRSGFRFFGNVELGRDLSIDDLRKHYHAVVLASGAKSDRRMNIPGEDLAGSHAATAFVGWYNGHPDYQDLNFDLSRPRVAVIGNGNVAMDVTRILAGDPALLEATDISAQALDALRRSRVREIFLLGRRGPLQAAFTNPEIRELCHLQGADLVTDPKEAELDPLSKEAWLKAGVTAQKNVEILTEQSKQATGAQPRKIVARFLVSPVELIGENGRVVAIKLEKNKLFQDKDGTLRPEGTGRFETLPVDLVFRSVGYKGVPLPGVPYDQRSGTVPNHAGRVVELLNRRPLPGLYVVGWAKRGPTGVIGTNKPDSIETVKQLLEDFAAKHLPAPEEKDPDAVVELLAERDVRFVTYADWKRIDQAELALGKSKGKVREKFVKVSEMLTALKSAPPRSAPDAK